MKKFMMGFVALAAVVGATALPAMADSWFDGGIATGWPTATSLSGGAWTNTETAAFAENAVTFTNVSSALTFAATEERSPANGEVVISSSVTFTPRTTLPAPTAKAGVVSYDNFFYVLAKDTAGDTNIWTKTDIAATATATVNITFPSATTANYKIGESTYNATIASVESVQNVKFSGIGKISGLSATASLPPPVTVTVTPVTGASKVTVSNGTVEVIGEGNPPVYTVGSNTAVKVVYTADESYLFPDGKTTWETNFTASAATVTVTIPESEKPVEAETPSLTVTTTNDVVDDSDGLISLREAIAYAAAGTTSTVEGHTGEYYIDFDYATLGDTFTIALVKAKGALTVNQNKFTSADNPLTISVDAGKSVTIDGGNTFDAQGKSLKTGVQILNIASGNNVTLNNLIFTKGYAYNGGAICTTGNLTITGSTFTNNTTDNGGGAIYSVNKSCETSITIESSIFENNHSESSGGAVYIELVAKLTVADSVFKGNSTSTESSYLGGAIAASGAKSFIVTGSTFINNSTESKGGAIYCNAGHSTSVTTTIANSTFIGNNIAEHSSAIYNRQVDTSYTPTLNLINNVIINNFIGNDDGGIVNSYGVNYVDPAIYDNADKVFTTGIDTLVSTTSSKTFANAAAPDVEPTYMTDEDGNMLLKYLGDADGKGVYVHKDAAGNIGWSSDGTTITWLSGTTHENVTEITVKGTGGKPNAGSGATASSSENSLTVTTLYDVFNPHDGLVSLRDAIAYAANGTASKAEGHTGEYYIDFDYATLTDTFTIELVQANGALAVSNANFTAEKPLTIAAATGKSVTISGGYDSSIADSGVQIMTVAASNNVTLNNLTFTKGYADYGGAIYNAGTLTVTGATFTDNTAAVDGDAIYNLGTLNWDLTGEPTSVLKGYDKLSNSGTLQITIDDAIAPPTNIVIATGDFSNIAGKDTFTITNALGGAAYGTVTVDGVGVGNDTLAYAVKLAEEGSAGSGKTNLVFTAFEPVAMIVSDDKATTNYYTSLEKAIEAFPAPSNNETLYLLQDVVMDDLTITKSLMKFDLNGKTITIPADKTVTFNAGFKVFNTSDPLTGGLVVNGKVQANATVNLSQLKYGTGGLIAHAGGSISIGKNGRIVFMDEWENESPNELMVKTPGFMTAVNGAKAQMGDNGTIYTYTDGVFVAKDAVAKAECETKIVGTETATNYVDTFKTVAAALAAVTNNGTVTMLQTVTVTAEKDLEIPETVTLDLTASGYMIATNGLVNKGVIKVYQEHLNTVSLEAYANIVGTLLAGEEIKDASLTMVYPMDTTINLTTETIESGNIVPTVKVNVPAGTLVWNNGVGPYKQMFVTGNANFGGDIAYGLSADHKTLLSVTGKVTLASNVTITNNAAMEVVGTVMPADSQTITLSALNATFTNEGCTLEPNAQVVSGVAGYMVVRSDAGVYSLVQPTVTYTQCYGGTLYVTNQYNGVCTEVKSGDFVPVDSTKSSVTVYAVPVYNNLERYETHYQVYTNGVFWKEGTGEYVVAVKGDWTNLHVTADFMWKSNYTGTVTVEGADVWEVREGENYSGATVSVTNGGTFSSKYAVTATALTVAADSTNVLDFTSEPYPVLTLTGTASQNNGTIKIAFDETVTNGVYTLITASSEIGGNGVFLISKGEAEEECTAGGAWVYIGAKRFKVENNSGTYTLTVEDGRFAITYDAMGGAFANSCETNTIDAYVNKGYEFPPDPTRDNYTFDGWFRSWTNNAEQVVEMNLGVSPVVPLTDHLLYAKWTPVEVRPTEKDISIPDMTNGVPVLEIASGTYAQKTHPLQAFETMATPVYLQSIGASAFNGVTTLKKLIITRPRSYDDPSIYTTLTIGARAFASCTSLEEIRLPEGVAYLDDAAFQNCAKLKRIVFTGTNTVAYGLQALYRCGYDNGAGELKVYMSSEFSANNASLVSALQTWNTTLKIVPLVDISPLVAGTPSISVADFGSLDADRRVALLVRVSTVIPGALPDASAVVVSHSSDLLTWTMLTPEAAMPAEDGTVLVEFKMPAGDTGFLKVEIQ